MPKATAIEPSHLLNAAHDASASSLPLGLVGLLAVVAIVLAMLLGGRRRRGGGGGSLFLLMLTRTVLGSSRVSPEQQLPTLAVRFSSNSSYDVISASGEHAPRVLFSGDGAAIFCDGRWWSSTDGLELESRRSTSGDDGEARGGMYAAMELSWRTTSGVRLITTAKSYKSGYDVAFEWSVPDGASDTSQASRSRDAVIVEWPAFRKYSLDGTLSWQGSFMSAQHKLSVGSRGGPAAFYSKTDPSRGLAVVGAPLGHWKASSAGENKRWDGVSAWAPGISATITSLPSGFSHGLWLKAGYGITPTIAAWGSSLRKWRKTTRANDVTIEKIGYQTDNGAYYVFCGRQFANCSKTMLDVKAGLDKQGLKMGYLSYQGAGASSSDGKAPWCVTQWGVDGGQSKAYPLSVGGLHKALGLPMQLYAPYFCNDSIYFESISRSPLGGWSHVTSNTSLPGCSDFLFKLPAANVAYAFYRSFFKRGKSAGMVSFEPDFMNQNYNCIDEFTQDVSTAATWQKAMNDAAAKVETPVQWCYATPSDALATLDLPYITNMRVSTDFCYGNSWRIGLSSLLTWAVGIAPSKDTLWTSVNGRFEVPGCPWKPDHENPAVEMHVLLALLSTGPVGISDAIGQTNATLVRRMTMSDGTLLQPARPIVSVDATLSNNEAPPGQVLATHAPSESDARVHLFVSFLLQDRWRVPASQLFPVPEQLPQLYAIRAFDEYGRLPCATGDKALNGCIDGLVTITSPDDTLFVAPAADKSNVTGGTDYRPTLTAVWPVCQSSGWVLLGELDKYVPLATKRFPQTQCSANGVSATLCGAAGEGSINVSALKPDVDGKPARIVVKRKVAIPPQADA